MGRIDRSTARAARVTAWKGRVAGLLATAAGAAPEAGAAEPYPELAAAVVGMFDAGARDAEVAAFLKRAAATVSALSALTEVRLAALAAELHRAAAEPPPHVAT